MYEHSSHMSMYTHINPSHSFHMGDCEHVRMGSWRCAHVHTWLCEFPTHTDVMFISSVMTFTDFVFDTHHDDMMTFYDDIMMFYDARHDDML